MQRHYLIAVILGVMLMVCGCRRQPSEAMLRIYELTETAPAQATAALDSLCVDSLSERDQRFYDFLRLKIDDKTYVRHSSDSTIRALLAYYDGDSRFGPEVHYYAGKISEL